MSRLVITNPILKGFNPDPSICRAGDDYYIATSTFEWFPGVQIHHSRDLVHWDLVCRPLSRPSQLDMRGEMDSCGVWAPCLTYADGMFWLLFSDMKRRDGSVKDVHNYLVTAPSIEGPWSDPIYLNSSGFDPSLFHDDDGRKWLVNVWWDYRARPPRFPGDNSFSGIACQEYDVAKQKLKGPVTNIFKGTSAGLTEGPHLYHRDGWYYIMVAEGGTGYNHAATMGRSRSLEGPYELHPDTYVVTTRGKPQAPLQRAGHADFVDTPEGETYLVHLTGRPIAGLRRCPLGRETAIQKIEWGCRRLAPHCRRQVDTKAGGRGAGCAGLPFPRRTGGISLLARCRPAEGFPMATHALRGSSFLARCSARVSAPLRPRSDWLMVRASAGRPSPDGICL